MMLDISNLRVLVEHWYRYLLVFTGNTGAKCKMFGQLLTMSNWRTASAEGCSKKCTHRH